VKVLERFSLTNGAGARGAEGIGGGIARLQPLLPPGHRSTSGPGGPLARVRSSRAALFTLCGPGRAFLPFFPPELSVFLEMPGGLGPSQVWPRIAR
jgi:hypothetical protein